MPKHAETGQRILLQARQMVVTAILHDRTEEEQWQPETKFEFRIGREAAACDLQLMLQNSICLLLLATTSCGNDCGRHT